MPPEHPHRDYHRLSDPPSLEYMKDRPENLVGVAFARNPNALLMNDYFSTASRPQANTVATSNALALVIINNGADGEDLFRVAATLGGRSGGGEEPKGPENMPTVSQQGMVGLSKENSEDVRFAPYESVRRIDQECVYAHLLSSEACKQTSWRPKIFRSFERQQ